MWKADSREPFHAQLRIGVLEDALGEENQSYGDANENRVAEGVGVVTKIH
jgi:hypothetical protein